MEDCINPERSYAPFNLETLNKVAERLNIELVEFDPDLMEIIIAGASQPDPFTGESPTFDELKERAIEGLSRQMDSTTRELMTKERAGELFSVAWNTVLEEAEQAAKGTLNLDTQDVKYIEGDASGCTALPPMSLLQLRQMKAIVSP